MTSHRRLPETRLARGLVLVLGAALVFSACARDTDAGSSPEPAASTDSVSTPSEAPAQPHSAQGSGGAERSPLPARQDVPVTSASIQEIDRKPEPVRVSYPGIGAELPVEPHGVAEDGQMDLPDDAGEGAWYKHGMVPAQGKGTTVIAAHAGSEQTPVGPLYRLTEAQQGDEVTVIDTEGDHHRYRVVETQQLHKDGLDFTPYFQRSGPSQLVLITCGGTWVPEANSYAENVIVIAEPAS